MWGPFACLGASMADTLRALDAAVQNHIAEAFPGSVTDSWVLIAHSNGIEDDNHDLHNYRMVTADHQPWHTDAGIMAAGNRIIKDAWDFGGCDEDDD